VGGHAQTRVIGACRKGYKQGAVGRKLYAVVRAPFVR